MPDKRKLLFIANPISGDRGKIQLEKILPNHLDLNAFEFEIYHTKSRGDATRKAIDTAGKVDAVIAVGGDGTINEVAQGLVNTDTAMGIIPNGSGNGFANYFNIPFQPEKAIIRINAFEERSIDTGIFNDLLFLSVAGLGFDAAVAHAFDKSSRRGFGTYIWLTLKAFQRFEPSSYDIDINGQRIEQKAFLVTVANATQFGNNAHIAPQAQLDDGVLDLVILKPFKWWHAFKISHQLFNQSIHKSRFCQIIRTKHVTIKSRDTLAQIDGEPILTQATNTITIHPASLKMIV